MDDYSRLDLVLTYFREFVTDESQGPRHFLVDLVSIIATLQIQGVLFSLSVGPEDSEQ